jgi:hypothetical protein
VNKKQNADLKANGKSFKVNGENDDIVAIAG